MSVAPTGLPWAPSRAARRQSGWSLLDMLVTLVLIGLLTLATVPIAARTVVDARSAAAAREFALLFYALRWRSVSENRNVGLFFEQVAGRWRWWEVADGNGNGLRTAEVRNGTDPKRSGPHELESTHQGVRLGFPVGQTIPRIPPQGGSLSGTDPIRFGVADLIAFSARGRASSGTLYLTDGVHRVYGIRLYGASTRIRVWRWDDRELQWQR